MKSTIVSLVIAATALIGCTHTTVATEPAEPRTPASNTGEVGSVDERETTANWYRKEMAKAHMQIAARMSQARRAGLVCDTDAYHADVLSEFNQALGLDKNVAVDSDVVAQLKTTLTYRLYMAAKKDGPMDWDQRLQKLNYDGLVWRAFGQGVYGTTTILTQRANGVLEIAHATLDDNDKLIWNTTKGSWKIATYQGKKKPNGTYRDSAYVLYLTIGNRTRAYDIEEGTNTAFGSGYRLKLRGYKSDFRGRSDFTEYINDECEA